MRFIGRRCYREDFRAAQCAMRRQFRIHDDAGVGRSGGLWPRSEAARGSCRTGTSRFFTGDAHGGSLRRRRQVVGRRDENRIKYIILVQYA